MVRVAEVEKALDIGGVQTYVINSARVLFLNERPPPRGGGAAAAGKAASSTHYCQICARALLDPFRFCSLGCKVQFIIPLLLFSFFLSRSIAQKIFTSINLPTYLPTYLPIQLLYT